MTALVINGLNEEDFRRSVENRLREGRVNVAIDRLRSLLPDYAGPGGLLPERFLTVQPSDLIIEGWDELGDAIKRRDLPGRLITGISVAFGWPGENPPAPDANGLLKPLVEVSYYSDSSFPFSKSSREDLLDGYSAYGCTWHGDAEASDNALSVSGIDDLHGALALLEARLLASEDPDEDGIRAGSLGACLLSALLVQAVTDQIAQKGLPRPVCVMAGSNDVYPYFDAPVAGLPEDLLEKEEELPPNINGAPVPRYSSLLVTGIPRARKRAILVLEDTPEDAAARTAQVRHQDAPNPVHETAQSEFEQVQHPVLDGEDSARPLLASKPLRKPHVAGETPSLVGLSHHTPPRFDDVPIIVTRPDPRPEPLPQSAQSMEPMPVARRTFPPTRPASPDAAFNRETLDSPARPVPASPPPFTPEQVAPGPDLQDRLQSLLANYAPPMADPAPAPAPYDSAEAEAEAEPAASEVRDDGDYAPEAEPAEAAGLFARLRRLALAPFAIFRR